MVIIMKTFNLILIITFVLILAVPKTYSKEFIIFSIAEDIPMGIPNEVPKKNYYLNLGQLQGVDQGAVLDVYRTISRLDPYSQKQRYYFKIKIGELEVLHSEQNASIAFMKNLNHKDNLLYDINAFMIGDQVNINGIKEKAN